MTVPTEARARISTVKGIIEAIATSGDMVEVFRTVRRNLEDLIPCEVVSLIYNNAAARYFYLVPALSEPPEPFLKEISIPYSQTSLTEILTSKTSRVRNQIENWAPGDAKFIPGEILSDLAVPVWYGENVLGILYLGSAQKNAFNRSHLAMAEEVALLLGLAIERAKLTQELTDRKKDASRWREKYASLLESITEPVAIVNYEDDLIYETNKAFELLTDYSADQLHGMRYSLVHPEDRRSDLESTLKVLATGERAELDRMPIVRKDGKQIPTRLRVIPLREERHSMLLALYQDLTKESELLPEEKNKSEALLSLFEVTQNLDASSNLVSFLDLIIERLGSAFQAKYVSVHLRDEESDELKLVRAQRFPQDPEVCFSQPWVLGIGEGPYRRVVQEKRLLQIKDVFSEPDFQKWRPIAEKLGYASLISLPCIHKTKVVGVLNLFFEEQKSFTQGEVDFLKIAAAFLALVVENDHLYHQSRDKAGQIAVINEITNSINSSLNLEQVIQTTVLEVKKIIQFDHASMILFDDSGENIQIFTVVSETISKFLKRGQWLPIGDSGLGWIQPPEAEEMKRDEAFFRELASLEEKVKSRMNVLLLCRDKYLGTFSLSSLEPHRYSQNHLDFLGQIAGQVATAIENARLFEEANKRLTEFQALADVSKSISSSLDIDVVLSHIVKAAALALGAKVCTIRFVEEDKPLPRATSNIPGVKDSGLGKELETFIAEITQNLKPVYVEDMSSVSETNGEEKVAEEFRSYLGVPVISRDKAIAILSVYWEAVHSITDREINLISTIANQAASAIENARLYRETVRNTEELKKANEELENFVYTVSHDLKSPIVSIQGFASIMANDYQKVLDGEGLHYLERIQCNANQMEKLIGDLLELSRIGRVVNRFEEVDTIQILEQALSELMYQLEEKKINLVIQKDLPRIYCDRNRIAQVFTNLIGNSIKYLGDDNPQPQIEVGCEDHGEIDLFYVKDNGIGIKKEYHEQIFGLFQTLHKEKNKEGTGVGLTIVKRIIESHKGKVWVESDEGQGATFYFTIPKRRI